VPGFSPEGSRWAEVLWSHLISSSGRVQDHGFAIDFVRHLAEFGRPGI
jgi:hypothetical protein